jgi:hypothetical protein
LYGGYPKKFAGLPQNPKKNIGTSNQPIKTKIFPKKVCLVPLMSIGAKNSYGGYPMDFGLSQLGLDGFDRTLIR